MICKELNKINAFMDGELTRDERKQFSTHLQDCNECQDMVQEMKKLDQWMDVRVKNGLPEIGSSVSINTDKAWQRFQTNVENEDFQYEGEIRKSQNNRRKNMKKSTKRWIVTAASVAILSGVFTIPHVQSIASEFLAIFRINRVEFVKLSRDDINKVNNFLSGDQVGTVDLKGLGSISTTTHDKDQFFRNMGQAKKAKVVLPAIPSNYTMVDISRSAPRDIQLTLDTKKVNQLLKQLKVTNVKLSDNLDKKTFILHMPVEIHFTLQKNGDSFNFTQFSLPKIEVEKGVNVNEIRDVILALPFIPEPIKDKFVDPNNWKNTLLLPIYADNQHTEEITIQGSKALVLKNKYFVNVIWHKNGKINILKDDTNEAIGSKSKKKIEDQMKKLADQIK